MTGAFFIVGWIAPTAIGFQPQHPGDGTRPFLTVAWEPRLGTTEIAYDPADVSAVRLDL
jgi:hypothetical protein